MNQELKQNANTENIVLCFCKQPTPGLVKTRLAKNLGNESATEVYKLLLDETIKTISKLEFKVFLYCYPDSNHPTFKHYKTEFNLALENQHGEDLGMKMYNAMMKHLNANASTTTNVVLLGSDCLEIDANYINQTFEALNSGFDVVLGPAKDGGYALIGANKIDKSIFQNISWSTNQVLKQTEKKLKDLNWKYHCFSSVRDLDNFEDYKYFSTHEKFKKLF